MAIGTGNRVVIEMDAEEKQRIYAALKTERLEGSWRDAPFALASAGQPKSSLRWFSRTEDDFF